MLVTIQYTISFWCTVPWFIVYNTRCSMQYLPSLIPITGLTHPPPPSLLKPSDCFPEFIVSHGSSPLWCPPLHFPLPLRSGNFGKRHRCREDGHMKMEAETAGMLPQSQKHPGLLQTGRSKEGSSRRDLRGSMTLEHIEFELLVSRTDVIKFCYFKPTSLW